MSRAGDIARWHVWDRIGASVSDVLEYSRVAAAWEGLRRKLATGGFSPVDAEDYRELTARMRELVADMGFTTEKRWHLVPCVCTSEHPNGVAGVTDKNGFLLGDPDRIVYRTWQAARG